MLNGKSRRSVAAARTRTWPAISPAVRLRTSPILPVRQNTHDIAHPTCVEMQNVIDGVSGLKTDSIWRWSASSSKNLRVPSADSSSLTIRGVEMAKSRLYCDGSVREQWVIG